MDANGSSQRHKDTSESSQQQKDAELLEAAQQGDRQRIGKLMALGASVNARDPQGRTALMKATIEGHLDCVKLLVNTWAADVNDVSGIFDQEGHLTPLMFAAQGGHFLCMNILIQAGADAKAKSRKDTAVLMYAVEKGDHQCIDLLIKAGADVNAMPRDGEQALVCAAEKGDPQCIDLLIQAGADVNALPRDGEQALVCAARYGNYKCMEILVQAGADVNAVQPNGKTALLMASRNGFPACVKLLLQHGADVNYTRWDQTSALISAASGGHYQCLELLIQAGADVNAVHKYGGDLATALQPVCRDGYTQCLKLLIQHGADVNYAADLSGFTPLFATVAVQVDDSKIKCMQQLFRAGARVNILWRRKNVVTFYFADHELLVTHRAAMLLLAAGEVLTPRKTEYPAESSLGIPQYILYQKNHFCLKHICREVIRNHLLEVSNVNLFTRAPRLGLPPALTAYMVYDVSLDDQSLEEIQSLEIHGDEDDSSSSCLLYPDVWDALDQPSDDDDDGGDDDDDDGGGDDDGGEDDNDNIEGPSK